MRKPGPEDARFIAGYLVEQLCLEDARDSLGRMDGTEGFEGLGFGALRLRIEFPERHKPSRLVRADSVCVLRFLFCSLLLSSPLFSSPLRRFTLALFLSMLMYPWSA